ncbi:MAG: tyrosine recombinase XerC [Ruminococcaceae bacterium]|nr:tyrosine recombinase XerC [Oscillospiraceae bacterium]
MDQKLLIDCPGILRDYLIYMETIRGRSTRTVETYYIDLRLFFRYIKHLKGLVACDAEINDISIQDVDITLIRKITLSDIYEFLNYALADRSNNANTRARKVSCIRSFFKYLTSKVNLLEENPTAGLDSPSTRKSLPKYLNLEESLQLLTSLDPDNKPRDYCIITLFINCGMRLSELTGINLTDIKKDTIRILGKGNKERIVYLNDACKQALELYISRRPAAPKEPHALFISRNGRRISARRVEQIVSSVLANAGLDGKGYSAHKLRHTAATLMYQYGQVDVNILKEILGHANLATTQIYTHVASSQVRSAMDSSPLSGITSDKVKKNQKKKSVPLPSDAIDNNDNEE